MKIRFQADADLKPAILTGTLFRVPTIDFQRAEAVPLEGLDDLSVLAVAAQEGRVLVSHDVNTMESYFRHFTQIETSPGLILIPQLGVSVSQAIDGLILVWETLDAAELENRVCLFPSLVVY